MNEIAGFKMAVPSIDSPALYRMITALQKI